MAKVQKLATILHHDPPVKSYHRAVYKQSFINHLARADADKVLKMTSIPDGHDPCWGVQGAWKPRLLAQGAFASDFPHSTETL